MGNTSYLYHTNGLLQSEDGPWPNDIVSYGYTINRLRQSLSLKNSSGTLLWGQTNSYDAANRLTNLVSGAGSFVYQYPANAASRRVQKLTLANTAFIDNTYDALARLTATTLKHSGSTVKSSGVESGHKTQFLTLEMTNVASVARQCTAENLVGRCCRAALIFELSGSSALPS